LLILASVVGVVTMPHLYDRLHYLGPASGLGPLLVAGAVVARESLNHQGIEALLVAGVLLVFGPVLTHAMARAARIREHGDWTLQPGEKVRGP
jgi:multisubunit Na+/H+ antiporter MnhG subunit